MINENKIMSFREEQASKFFMGGNTSNYKNLILPQNPFTKEREKQIEEEEAKKARDLLIELETAKQEELKKKLQTLEMLPMFNKVILLPYPNNPYKKSIEGSIIVEYNGDFMNPDSGEKDKLQELVGCAKVIEVGPEVKYVKAGDDIYYDPRTCYPVPFMSLGYKLTTEPQILCVLNENLKERFKMN
jgi:hypothetical protein